MRTRQTSNRNLVSPAEITRRATSRAEDIESLARERAHQARCLVSLQGYSYLKAIAADLLKDFACKPGKTTEEKIQWETYSHMKWALDKTFGNFEAVAALSEKPPTLK